MNLAMIMKTFLLILDAICSRWMKQRRSVSISPHRHHLSVPDKKCKCKQPFLVHFSNVYSQLVETDLNRSSTLISLSSLEVKYVGADVFDNASFIGMVRLIILNMSIEFHLDTHWSYAWLSELLLLSSSTPSSPSCFNRKKRTPTSDGSINYFIPSRNRLHHTV